MGSGNPRTGDRAHVSVAWLLFPQRDVTLGRMSCSPRTHEPVSTLSSKAPVPGSGPFRGSRCDVPYVRSRLSERQGEHLRVRSWQSNSAIKCVLPSRRW